MTFGNNIQVETNHTLQVKVNLRCTNIAYNEDTTSGKKSALPIKIKRRKGSSIEANENEFRNFPKSWENRKSSVL